MKYIVYSLFGDNPKYLRGAVANARQAPAFYPGWRCVFFVDQLFAPTCDELRALGAIVTLSPWPDVGGLYWRHFMSEVASDDTECYIVRDTDSRLSHREVAAVDAWLASDKVFHLMRDHPGQSHPIMQGMYGVKGRSLRGIQPWFVGAPNVRCGADDKFQQVYEQCMKGRALEHGEFYTDCFPDQIPFPVPREGYRFVGEIFDEGDQPNDDWKALTPEPTL